MSKLDRLIDEIRLLPPADRERLLDEVQQSPESASTDLPGAHDALLGMAGTKHLAEASRTRSDKTVA